VSLNRQLTGEINREAEMTSKDPNSYIQASAEQLAETLLSKRWLTRSVGYAGAPAPAITTTATDAGDRFLTRRKTDGQELRQLP
jgi:hypothetical protein